jgi:hypothetical protein
VNSAGQTVILPGWRIETYSQIFDPISTFFRRAFVSGGTSSIDIGEESGGERRRRIATGDQRRQHAAGIVSSMDA